jgi:hypothetical protein
LDFSYEIVRGVRLELQAILQLPRLTLESIASREGKSERSIRMTLSVAFLAPEIVKAAVEGRLSARLWYQASRRPADGLAGSVAHARISRRRRTIRPCSVFIYCVIGLCLLYDP